MAENQLLSVIKMMAILDCFTPTARRLSVAEIAQQTGIPRGTVHRIATTLLELGLLEQERRRDQYALGVKALGLGTTVLSNMELHAKAAPSTEALRRATGEVVHLAVFDGASSITIDRPEQDGRRVDDTFILKTTPANACSTGKAALAFQDERVINRFIAMGMRKIAPKTIVDPAAFREELTRTRDRGYAVDDEESGPGVRCVGAPIRSLSGRVFAAISVSGPKDRMGDEQLAEYSGLVTHYANAISLELGWNELSRNAE